MLYNIAGLNKPLLNPLYKIFYFTGLVIAFSLKANGQLTISGTVLDSTRTMPVKDVLVKSSNGTFAITDSAGHYNIVSTDKDSLTFFYQNKTTTKFAVKQIENIGNFEIALHVRVTEKFKTLKEIKIFSKNYRQDSLENREYYAKIFNYKKPGIALSSDAYTGAAGLDINELINMFRFKRNKQLQRMHERLMEQEKENYINYRFNKSLIRRITRLDRKELEDFMIDYRPDFEFAQNSNILDFYQYILNASYQFKKGLLLKSKGYPVK